MSLGARADRAELRAGIAALLACQPATSSGGCAQIKCFQAPATVASAETQNHGSIAAEELRCREEANRRARKLCSDFMARHPTGAPAAAKAAFNA